MIPVKLEETLDEIEGLFPGEVLCDGVAESRAGPVIFFIKIVYYF
jgi:hypothetical protein